MSAKQASGQLSLQQLRCLTLLSLCDLLDEGCEAKLTWCVAPELPRTVLVGLIHATTKQNTVLDAVSL